MSQAAASGAPLWADALCSAQNILPTGVDEAVIDAFLGYRRRTTSLAADSAARRSLARHWNDLARKETGWPGQLLHEPPSRKPEAFGRRASLEAALRMATRIGIGMEELTSLSSFLDPAVSRRVLAAYWEKSGDEPSIFTINLAILFVGIARSANCLGLINLKSSTTCAPISSIIGPKA